MQHCPHSHDEPLPFRKIDTIYSPYRLINFFHKPFKTWISWSST